MCLCVIPHDDAKRNGMSRVTDQNISIDWFKQLHIKMKTVLLGGTKNH